MSKNNRLSFHRNLDAAARELRLDAGDVFELKDEATAPDGQTFEWRTTEHGNAGAQAWCHTFGNTPEVADVKVINECVRTAASMIDAVLEPLMAYEEDKRFGGTLLDEIVFSFAVGAIHELYTMTVTNGANAREVLLQKTFIDLGRDWARRRSGSAVSAGQPAQDMSASVHGENASVLLSVAVERVAEFTGDKGRAIARAIRDAAIGRTKGDA